MKKQDQNQTVALTVKQIKEQGQRTRHSKRLC